MLNNSTRMKNPVILIVEDDEPSFLYLESVLRNVPASLVHAVNGKEAVDICKANEDVSIVLMDLKMPVMDGLDATRFIKEIRKDLPVIAITAYAYSGDQRAVMVAGCDDYLTKPLKKELLYLKLESYGIKTGR